MRVSRLSELTGIPVPTIKFYIRDGLVPKGTATARNQAIYGQEHVDRLRLIRALTGIGRLSLETSARDVLAAIDDQFVQRAFVALDQVAPKVREIVEVGAGLGVVFTPERLAAYREAAEVLDKVEMDMCAEADSQSIVLTSLLGDALIVAMRSQVRTETPA